MLRISILRTSLATAFAVILSACGTTSPAVDLAPVTQQIGSDFTELTFDSNGGLTGVSINGMPQILSQDSGGDHGVVKAFAGGSTVFAAIGDTGDSYFYASATNGTVSAHGTVAYVRKNTTSMPTTGSASYTGDYAGFLRLDGAPTNNVTYRIRGDLNLSADFAANSVSGGISNRVFHVPGTNALAAGNTTADVTLAAAPIDANGAFTGATSGGIITNAATWTPPVGTYSGLISGATGNEVVGGLSIAHFSPGLGAFTEIGGFIGSE